MPLVDIPTVGAGVLVSAGDMLCESFDEGGFSSFYVLQSGFQIVTFSNGPSTYVNVHERIYRSEGAASGHA
jgi:hypothetical protein